MSEKRTRETTCVDCGKTRRVAMSGHLPPERCRQCAMKAAMRQMIHKDKR